MRYQVTISQFEDDAKDGDRIIAVYGEVVDYNPTQQIKAVVGRAPRIRRKRGEKAGP